MDVGVTGTVGVFVPGKVFVLEELEVGPVRCGESVGVLLRVFNVVIDGVAFDDNVRPLTEVLLACVDVKLFVSVDMLQKGPRYLSEQVHPHILLVMFRYTPKVPVGWQRSRH